WGFLFNPTGPFLNRCLARFYPGVDSDFRAPDVLRFGLTPLYLRYVDVYDAVERLRHICATRAWDKPHYRERAAVT
ncbi:MAG: kynureninase, partial [Novosphingobium sp.]|nr:kynureninase [Novosphingobium sp.]